MLYKEQRETIMTKKGETTMRKSSLFVLVFGSMMLAVSAAGVINWTPYPLPPVGNIIGQFNNVIFDGTQFWAVGANGWVQKSPDGVTWTSVAPGPTYFFYDIAYGGGNQYVVVGAGSGGGSSVYVTNNGGATWSQSTTGVPGFFSLYNVAHGATAGEYVAVGSGGTIVRSTDGGVTWSPPANYSPSPYGLNSVIYAPIGTGLYVAVGGNGIILTSNDGGNTWTPQNSGTTVVLANVAYANGLLVAVGWNGTILTSPNGVNWTQVTPAPTTKNLTAVTYGPCGWVAAGVQGTVLSSPNGTSWTPETSNTTAALLGVAYGNNRYVVVGQGTTLVGLCTEPAGAPDLTIVKRASGTPWPVGGTGTFAISVSNAGSGPVPGGTAVTVTESLPAGLTLTGVSGTGWNCSPTSGSGSLTVTCTYTVPAGGLAAGASLPVINFTVKVDTAGPYTNCARVSGTLQGAVLQEPTGNNQSCVDIPSGGKCAALPSDAVAWWPLNESSGATAVTDVVGGHTGMPVSGPVGSGGPNPATGVVGGAFSFTSQSTYVRVPNSPALNFGAGDFTIDAWVNPVQVGPQFFQPIVDKAQALATKGGVQGYRLYVKNGKVIFALADGSTTAMVSAPAAYGIWQFVAAERAGTNLNLYINGALAATAALPPNFGSVSNTADLLVGGITGVGIPVQPVVGEIGLDEVELFSRALTAQEVQAIHQAGPAGKCEPQPPSEPTSDLGDAPDSTNHPNKPMTAYSGVPAKFPTVFDPATGLPQGPKHLAPKKLAWLGPDVSFENETDLLPDADGVTNIDPTTPAGVGTPDRDKFDDGVMLPIAIPFVCGQTQFKYTVTSTAPAKLYVNVWFDFNRDGDWNDPIQKCPLGPSTTGSFTEWAVQNQLITVVPGPNSFTTPAFGAANPTKGSDMWMRITLTDQPIAPVNGADASGPASGYKYGETEDYLLKLQYTELCGIKWNDLNGNGKQDANEPGLAGWTIEVKDANGNIIGYAVTDAQGKYCVVVPSPGTYTVSEQQQAGWTQTAPPTPGTYTVTVPPGRTDLNFGNQQKGKAEICIFKFNDLNGNGQKEANEPPLAGWQFNVNPAPLPPSTNPVTTGQQGGRCFGVSAPGTYTITESVQAGWTPTTSNPQTVNISPGQLVNVYFGNQQCAPPPSGMVAWYRMDGNANDSEGSNNPSATNAISFVAGKDNQGVTFGPGGYIDIPHSPALAPQQFTIDAWVKPNGAPLAPASNNDFWGAVIVQKGVSPPTGYTNVPISLWWSAQQQKFGFTFGNMGMDEIVSSSTFPAGQWYHVAATYDGSAMKLYVNGNLEASKPFTSSITYDPLIPWTIGAAGPPIRAAGYPRTFNGVIDEVEIFNRALSAAEIQTLYKPGKCKVKKWGGPFDPTD
jgi:uncharacterized repeat protein (TIGR01451 family)